MISFIALIYILVSCVTLSTNNFEAWLALTCALIMFFGLILLTQMTAWIAILIIISVFVGLGILFKISY